MGQELLFSHFGDKETISMRIKKNLSGPSAPLVILFYLVPDLTE